jgi:hypothetical protein
MSSPQVTISSGIISERVGDELLVIVPGRTDTVRLSGHAADLFLDIQAGKKVDGSDPVVADLVDLGVVQASGMSRRGLIKAGAIGAGAGIAVMAMPGLAAASSSPEAFFFNAEDGFYADVSRGYNLTFGFVTSKLPSVIPAAGTTGTLSMFGVDYQFTWNAGDRPFRWLGIFNNNNDIYFNNPEAATLSYTYLGVHYLGTQEFGNLYNGA